MSRAGGIPVVHGGEDVNRVEVPPLLWAEWAGAFNQMRRERANLKARTRLLLDAAGPDAEEIAVGGVVVARVRDGRVHYIPPCGREQAESSSNEEGRPIAGRRNDSDRGEPR